jgi:hypothetical protein
MSFRRDASGVKTLEASGGQSAVRKELSNYEDNTWEETRNDADFF